MQNLKLFTVFLLLFISSFSAYSQDEEPADSLEYWKSGGLFNLNMNQVSLYNWASGGVNSISGGAFLDLFGKYEKDDIIWDNTLKLGYGLINQEGMKLQKTDDLMEFNSSFSKEAFAPKWYYAANLNFKSQFDQGYNDPELQQVVISDFLAPAYIITSIGFNYIPNDYFKVHLAPISSKITIVNNDSLANAGAYGVDAATYTEDGALISAGEKIRYEWGAFSRITYEKEVLTNVNLRTKMDLFWDYIENRGSVDVNWEILLGFKINKYLSTNLNFFMIYDDDIAVPLEEDADGNVIRSGPRIQLKQVLGLGVNVKF